MYDTLLERCLARNDGVLPLLQSSFRAAGPCGAKDVNISVGHNCPSCNRIVLRCDSCDLLLVGDPSRPLSKCVCGNVLLLDVSGATGPEPSSAHQASALGAPFDAVPSSSVDWRSRQRAQPLTLRTSPPASPPPGSIAALARAQQRPVCACAKSPSDDHSYPTPAHAAADRAISEVRPCPFAWRNS